MDNQKSWQIQLSQFGLASSSALILFGLVSSVTAFIFSFAVNLFGYRDDIRNLEQWVILAGIIVPTFVIISICLLFTEVYVSRQLKLWLINLNKNLVFAISLIVTTGLLLVFYFGFSQVISLIHNNFWL
jgi:signal transduction histidine kinase